MMDSYVTCWQETIMHQQPTGTKIIQFPRGTNTTPVLVPLFRMRLLKRTPLLHIRHDKPKTKNFKDILRSLLP